MEVVYIARVQSTLTEDRATIPESPLVASSFPSQIGKYKCSFITKYVQFKKCLFIRTPPKHDQLLSKE